MCKTSKEVQDKWNQEYGDFFVDEDGRIRCWINDKNEKRTVKKGFGIIRHKEIIRLAPYVWLPRLNQIIEMAQVRGKSFDQVTLEFYEWTKKPYEINYHYPRDVFETLEQVWLAFLMQSKYGKRWCIDSWDHV